jgi:hypothetical protein
MAMRLSPLSFFSLSIFPKSWRLFGQEYAVEAISWGAVPLWRSKRRPVMFEKAAFRHGAARSA